MKQRPREFVILYEDDAVIAIDKPAGLTAVPVRNSEMPSALALVIEAFKKRRERALVVHRIDRFTSGILLFAKNAVAREVLIRQFLAHTPVREYLAVVRGRLKQKDGAIVQYFEKEGLHQKLRRPSDPGAARAELRYKVERELIGATLVRASLVTGLQNQIRVQFAALGHPVIGDRKYRPEEASETRIDRVALHAAHLEFIHPITRKKVVVDCPMPHDLKSLLKQLSPKPRAVKE